MIGLQNVGAIPLFNGSPLRQPVLSAFLFANFCYVLGVALDLAHILGLDQAPHAITNMVLLGYRPAFYLALCPVIGLIRFGGSGDRVIDGKIIGTHGGVLIRIVFCPVLSHIFGIAPDFAGLPSSVLEPGVICHVYDGNDAFPLIIEDFAYVQIQIGIAGHGDIRCAVRRHNSAVAGAGDFARQIDLAPCSIDVLHHQLVCRWIPIDLRHIVKDLVRFVPLGAAVVDFVHGAVLNNGRSRSWSELLHIIHSITVHRSSVILVAALDQAVHVDIGGGHIDVPPGNIARGRLGGIGSRVRFGSFGCLISIILALYMPIICFIPLWLSVYPDLYRVKEALDIVFHAVGSIRQIFLRIAVDVDNARFVTLGNAAFGRDELDGIPLHACGAIRGAAADTDISASIVDGHVAVKIAELAIYLHIRERCIGDTIFILINLFQQLSLFRRRQRVVSIHLVLHRLLSGVCQIESRCLGTGSFVLYQKACRFAVGYAVYFLKICPVSFDIDAVDFGVSLGCVRRNGFGIVNDLASLLAHKDVVQFQIGVRLVCDGDAGRCVGAQIPRAGEVVRRHVDIAAAGGDVRDLHKIYGAASAGIDVVPLIILLRQPQTYHIVLDSGALGYIGRQQIRICPVVGLDHFVQFFPTRGHRIGIIKGSFLDAALYAVVGVVIGRLDGQPVRDAAFDGQLDGVSGARNQGTGHVDPAIFRHGLFRNNRIG